MREREDVCCLLKLILKWVQKARPSYDFYINFPLIYNEHSERQVRVGVDERL